MIDFVVDLSSLDELAKAYERVPEKVEAILDRNINGAKREKDSAIQRTYSRPIPTVEEYGKKRKKARAAATKKRGIAQRKAVKAAKKAGEVPAVKAKVKRPRKVKDVFSAAEKAVFVDANKRTRKRKAPTDPAWERTGAWKDGQRIDSAPGERTLRDTGKPAEAITNNPGGYAERLGKIPKGPDGVDRRNPAAERAFDVIKDQFQLEIEQMLENLS